MVKSMPRLVCIRLRGRIPRPPPARDPDTGERRPGRGGVYLKVTPPRVQTRFSTTYAHLDYHDLTINPTPQDILEVLAEFSHLEELDLPGVTDLRHGRLGPWCGTQSLTGAEAAEQNYRDSRDEHGTVEKVASIVVEALPRLQRLKIDWREATITHDENGQASASWAWSGRLDEYLDEILCRPKA